MTLVHRWLATAALAAGLGMGAMAPTPVHAQDRHVAERVVVDLADVIFRGGYPYYRYGNSYGYGDRLVVVRNRYGRPVYYRQVPYARSGPPYGNAYGYYGNGYSDRYSRTYSQRRVSCDRRGNCVTRYYDPRYDNRYESRYDNRYYNDRYDDRYEDRYGYSRGDRYWDGYRWRTR